MATDDLVQRLRRAHEKAVDLGEAVEEPISDSVLLEAAALLRKAYLSPQGESK